MTDIVARLAEGDDLVGTGPASAERPRRPLVLHLSADYPDPYRTPTTTAVERLVAGATEARHVVVSLFRTTNPLGTYFRDCGETGGVRLFACCYFGPPGGIGLAAVMRHTARRIARVLADNGLEPDVVHAHKFAFEGIAALWLVEKCFPGAALFVSVRGEAESKVFRYKPGYMPLLRRIAGRAKRVYYVSAWFRPLMEGRLGIDPEKQALLPNIVGNTRMHISPLDPEPRFVCVLNFDIRKRKGLEHLLAALARVRARHPQIGLDLIGGGSAESVTAVKEMIRQQGLDDAVRLLGRLDNAAVTEALPRYLGLALPSFNETFGMVYLEALFAGIPILYGRGTGIDGYLDGLDVGAAAEPGNVPEIAAALEYILDRNADLRRTIAAAAGEMHDRFDRNAILARYNADIMAVSRQAGTLP
ncbi:glycosyltransferase [Zhengella mangrovi]|nr:glycosyltransferase [Zhengella mangrovi]